MDLSSDEIEIELRADVPFELLDILADGMEPADEVVLADLAGGVTLRVDGEEIPLTTIAQSSEHDLVDGQGRILTMRWRAPFDLRGRHSVAVGNANLAETPCWFRNEVHVATGFQVHTTSLRSTRGRGSPWIDQRWLREERLRSITMDVVLADDPWSRFVRQVPSPRQSVRDAWALGGFAAWRQQRVLPHTISIALALSFLAGAGAGSLRPGFRPSAFSLTVGTILALCALAWTPSLSLGGAAGFAGILWLVAALIGVLDPTRGHLAGWLVVPWLLVALPSPWTFGLLIMAALGTTIGHQIPRRIGLPLLLLAGLLALTR